MNNHDCCHGVEQALPKKPHGGVPGASYTCPMHPEVRQDRPGMCPECGMTLIKTQGTEHKDQTGTHDKSFDGAQGKPSDCPKEFITQGLLDLPERLAAYKKQGAVFAKWRAVIRIDGDELPSASALHENAKRLAQYAKEAQTAGLVPILEPEVLLEGKHSRARARGVLVETLGTVFSVIGEHAVDRASVILKTSMALSGEANRKKDTPEEVAADTLAALMESVPRQVAGIAFLSGGQSPDQATDNLSAICRLSRQNGGAPWPLSFSYARALQDEALSVWKGKQENVSAARAAFLKRLAKVSAALSA